MPEQPDPAASAWLDRAKHAVADTPLDPQVERFGHVAQVADGIAVVTGLADARIDELVRFQRGQTGFVQGLDRGHVSVVLLDLDQPVQAGDRVTGTGEVVRVPTGPGLLGRVVDPLGRPLDGLGPIDSLAMLPVERPAPGIIDRAPVVRPVQTGTLVVDTFFALGRGQRELIVGDRATGKTTLALDAMLNQQEGDIVSVYVAIGQKASSVDRVITTLRDSGALQRSIVVVAAASAPAGQQWIAPFAGTTMAEHFRDNGRHAVVVLDDLSKHAACHREIALLTRQSPGREAYPGDIFYVHARLLERAAKLSEARGGGSLTALPVAETDAGNLSAYIPTNLISITDGQIVLDAKLFNEGQKPAVDVGTSVSRVGGKTQARALRDAAKTLRLDYAQFLELEMFTRFGGMPDTRVKAQLTRGARIREVLQQGQHRPLRLQDEIALVLAVQSGRLDTIAPADIPALRAALPAAIDHAAPHAAEACTEELTDRLRSDLLAAVDQTLSTLPGLAPEPAE